MTPTFNIEFQKPFNSNGQKHTTQPITYPVLLLVPPLALDACPVPTPPPLLFFQFGSNHK